MNVTNKDNLSESRRRRNALLCCALGIIAFAGSALNAIEPFSRTNEWQVYANLSFSVVALIAWIIATVLVWRGKVELGIQIGLIPSIIFAAVTPYWTANAGFVNSLGVLVGAYVFAGLSLPPALARRYYIAALAAAVCAISLDLIAPSERLVPQAASINLAVAILAPIAAIIFLFTQYAGYSLRGKLLVAFVALAILSTAGITFIATQAIRDTLSGNYGQDLRTHAQATALTIGITMDRNVDRMLTMSLDKRVQDDVAQITDSYPSDRAEREQIIAGNAARWASADPQENVIRNALNGGLAYSLRQFGDVFQGNKEVLMTDASGSVIAATDWQPHYNFAQDSWWQNAYSGGRGAVHIGQPEFNPMINEYGIRIALPIFAPGRQRVVGVLHSIFTLTALQRALLLNSFGESGKVDLLFPQGQILTSEGTFRALTPEEFTEIKNGISQPLATLNYRGTPLLSNQGVVGVSDEQPEPYLRSSAWRTIATIQGDEALAAVDAGAQAALLGGLVTIVAAALVALLLAQFLTRPIRRLTNVAEQIQGGDLGARAQVETGDEIGTLAQTFNSMTARLQDTLSGLELRVQERTAELSSANLALQSNSSYLSALSDTSAGLFERLELRNLLHAILERAGALVGTQNGFVFFVEPHRNEIQMRVGSGVYDDLVGTRAQAGVGLAGTVWQTGEPMVIEDYQKWEGRLPGSRRDALHAIVAVPLKRGAGKGSTDDETVGVIGLAYTEEGRKFGKTEVEILQRFAQLASIALDNAQLYENSEIRLQELAALNSISRIVTQENKLMPLIEKVGNEMCQIFGTDFAYVALLDPATEKIEFPYVVDDGKRVSIPSLTMGEGLTSQVISSRQPMRLTNANEEAYNLMGAVDSGDGASPESLLTVPMEAGERVIGALSVQRIGRKRGFTPEDQNLLTTIAASVSVGITNARLAQATQRRLAELAALNEISTKLTSDTSLAERFAQVGRELHSIFDVSSVYIALYDATNNLVRMPFFMGDAQEFVVEPFALGPGFASHIIQTRASLLINDDMKAQMQALQAMNAGEGDTVESYLGVPIALQNEVLGVIGLSAARKNKFQESDVRLLNTIASAVASAIQNARLLEQTQERARELDAVNSLAREITQQRSLDDLFHEIYLQVKSVMAADGVLISLYDDRTDTLTVPFLMDQGQRYEITPDALEFEHDFAEQVRKGEPLMINNTPEEVAELESNPAVAGAGRASRSRLYVPLMAGVRFLGMVSLHSYAYNAYKERDVSVLSGLASHIAVALENARLFEQTQNALAETNRLYRIAEAANLEKDELRFYQRVHEIVGETMPAKNFFVALHNPDDGTIDFPYFVDEKDTLPAKPLRHVNASMGSTAYVLQTRQALLATPRDFEELEARGQVSAQGMNPDSWLGVPLLRGDQSIGVVAVQSYDPAVQYTERDKQHLSNLSQGLANVIERKRAEEALRRSERALAEAMRLTHLGNWEYDVLADQFSFNDEFYAMLRTTVEREGGYAMPAAQYAERFVYPDDAAVVGNEIGGLIQTTDPNYSRQLDHRVIFGDGEVGYITVQFRIQKDAAGRTVKAMGANLDITARKRAELKLESALAETQRLAARERESTAQVIALNRRLTREGWREYLDQLNSHLVAEAGGPEEGNRYASALGERNSGARNGEAGNGEGSNGHATINVPIMLRGEVIGEIELEPEDAATPMSAEDMGLVTHVAENIGLALDNARLFTETQRRVTELDALNHISQAVTTELDLNALVNLIGDQLCTIFDVQNTYIALYDRETHMIALPYFVNDNQRVSIEPIPYGEGITSHIIRTRTALVLNENADREMEKLGGRVFRNPARSYLGVPISVGEDVTGVISVQSTVREGMFDEGNVRLLETIAATVGAAIQNAQLYGAMEQEVVTRQRAEEEIKLSLKEKKVLLKEIHHRVKNNLQIITSLLNLQSAQIRDPEAAILFRESQARVRSMALIHEKLYQSKDLARIDFDSYVRDLMVYLFRSYAANPDQIRTHIATDNMFLAIDTAIPCGLIISELVTNTIKYAFPNGGRGNLHISLGPEDDGHLTLWVKDDGVGFSEGFDWRASDSLGLQLVSTLSAQLHGTIAVNGKGGTSFKITFPG